ncbi:hypothetical protein JB92DRAFT_3133094 [Gautieria morchelliformis]|nr:hypothetical protein JB92DRAFT_3133094 [Gautieria morchelliformis]
MLYISSIDFRWVCCLNVCVLATGYFTTWNMTNATPGLTIFEAGGPWIMAYFVLTMPQIFTAQASRIFND